MPYECATMTFWQDKTLEELTPKEWEQLCDGCGRCCLMKLEDEDTGRVYVTSVACSLLNCETCQCSDYQNRAEKVADCLQLTPAMVRELTWLPATCAYALVRDNKPLYPWHPLLSGSATSVIEAGISVKGRITKQEHEIKDLAELENHLVSWPMKPPPKPKLPRKKR
jgi:uncharacterized protein